MKTYNRKKFIVGSRGSDLALTQTRQVMAALAESNPGVELELLIVKTEGDRDQTTNLSAFPAMGVFVKELQIALLERRIDLAIHSLKDVPEDEPEGLVLAAFPERQDPRDVFIGKKTFRELEKGARVGTGSPRRVLQLKKMRPDLEYVAIRGNVDTRIKQVTEGRLDGTVLAAAGLNRLNRTQDFLHSFSFSEMIPAIGQASLALECRVDDDDSHALCRTLNDELTEGAVVIERDFMRRVGGGCKVPMAAHVYPHGEGWRMLAVMGDPLSGKLVRVERSAAAEDAEEMLEEVTWQILEACKAQGIPTPRELPDGHLMGDGSRPTG